MDSGCETGDHARCRISLPALDFVAAIVTLLQSSSSSSRAQCEADDALRAQLSALPVATPSEQQYAALCKQLIESAQFWRAKADSERRKHEQAVLGGQHAITKLTQMVATEGEQLLSNLRSGALVVSPPGSSASPLAALLHGHSSGHATHPAHLSRRVSFNNDVLMVVSPDIGKSQASGDSGDSRADGTSDGGVPSIAEEGSSSGAPADARHRERRPSRAELEFNEGQATRSRARGWESLETRPCVRLAAACL